MKKMMTKVMCGVMLFVMIFGMGITGGCAKNMTVEQHINNISKRIEKNYMTKYTDLTAYEVYPLYNEKDELTQYYLVEFEPYGFIFVLVSNGLMQSCVGFGPYNYTASIENHKLSKDWRRYRLWPPADWLKYDDRLIYETDENGEFIYYNRSPYKVADVENEKLYLLLVKQGRSTFEIPAVKRGELYLNLISMEEFEYRKSYETLILPYYSGIYFCPKANFVL